MVVFARFWRDESGAPAMEYAIVAAMIAIACYAAFTALGGGLQNIFGDGSTGAAPVLENAASST